MSRKIAARKTKARGHQLEALAVAFTALVLVQSHAQAAHREVNRTRSIYVPVRFQACEHVSDVTLTIAGDPQPFTLGTRIFMFTYYPDKEALLPELTEVWIEAEANVEDGARTIRTNLIVTPERIVSSQRVLQRGPREIAEQLRRRRDVRLPEAVIHIQCEESCPRSPRRLLDTRAEESSSETEG